MKWNWYPPFRARNTVEDCPICRRQALMLIASICTDHALRPEGERSLPSIFGVDRITTGQGYPIGGEIEETWLANEQVIHWQLPMFLRFHAPQLLGFIDGGHGFKRQVPVLIDRLSKFFSASSNLPAWLDVLPEREVASVRFERDDVGFEQETLGGTPSFEDIGVSFPVYFGDGREEDLGIEDFHWGYVDEENVSGPPRTMYVERRLTRFGISYAEHWAFLANRRDKKKLDKHQIPASLARARNGFAGTAILNAVTFSGDCEANSEADILAFEFCKGTGDLLSIRHIVTPFATIQAMSPMQTNTLRNVLQNLA